MNTVEEFMKAVVPMELDIAQAIQNNKELTEEMKQYIRKNACSYPPDESVPNNADYLFATPLPDGNVYRYYVDREGNCYYDSKKIDAFEQEMKEAQRKHARMRYSARCTR